MHFSAAFDTNCVGCFVILFQERSFRREGEPHLDADNKTTTDPFMAVVLSSESL